LTDSIDIFKQGLAVHPDNLDLLVNMGLSYLWAGDTENADKAIGIAKDKAGKDPDKIKTLARVFIVNGYPDKAVDIYKQGIEVALADLQLYLLLEDTYLNAGKKKDAEGVKNTISRRFISSSKLTRYLDFYHEKIGLKDKVLDGYRNQLKSQPDNLELREMLAQTCFWNGLREEAIGEYLNILANQSFRKIKSMDQDSAKLFEATDRLSLLSGYFGRIEKLMTDKRSEISGLASRFKTNGTDADKSRKDAAQLASLIADGDEIVRQYEEITRIYKDDQVAAGDAIEKAKKDEENFEKMKTALSWEWDRNQSMSELEAVSKTGLVLADHVLARTFQLDGDLATAKFRFEKIIAEQPFAEAEFAYWETLLWSGNREAADKVFASFGKDMGAYMPYVAKIKPLVDLSVKQVNGNPGDQSGDLSDRAKNVMEKLSELASDARPNQAAIEDTIRILRERISKKVVRAYYSSQESSYLLRNELGDFYLRNEEQDKAIVQYKQVLAIDPNNVSAIYRLGTVYQWKKDWHEAMTAFEKVYKSDPGYENTTRLYNDLARQYADEVTVNANSYTDTGRLLIATDVRYWKFLNSILRIGVEYDLDYIQFYRWATPSYYSYPLHGIDFGLLIDLYGLNLKITPAVGVNIFIKDEFIRWEYNPLRRVLPDPDPEEDIPFPLPFRIEEFLAQLGYVPFYKLDYSLGFGNILSTYGTIGYRQYPASFAYHIPDVDEIWVNPSVLVNFSFINMYPYREGSLRFFANLDLLEDKNIIFNPGLEIYAPIIGIDNPNIVLSFTGSASYQNTFGDMNVGGYYKPNEVYQIAGQAGLFVKFGSRDKIDAPTLSLKFGGGLIHENNWQKNPVLEKKMTGEAMFRFNSDKGSFGIGGDFNITVGTNANTTPPDYGYDPDGLAFWSMNIKVEYTSKIQNLLAP
jgi:tetratricopeptide (TPR) repeat protein